MTSVVLPPLKRSITDIMDEELYQLPNSPIQVNNYQQQPHLPQSNQQPPRSDSPKFSLRAGSANGSPLLNHSQLYSHPNISNSSNLSNYLNIPDSVMDYKHNGTSNVAVPTYDITNLDMDLSQYNQPRVNPFTDYANPDSLNTTPPYQDTQVNYPPLPQQFPQKPNRRRRITTLDDDQMSQKKDDDYLLYNPDIQPSQLISNWNDDMSTLFIPNSQRLNEDDFSQEFLTTNNNIIPGYENDYLMADGFDEDVEEDLSDEEDEDKYFHVDDEFDELVMNTANANYYNNTQESNNDIEYNMNFMELDDYLKPNSMPNNDQSIQTNEIINGDFKPVDNEQPTINRESTNLMIDEDLANMNMDDDKQDEEENNTDDAHSGNNQTLPAHYHMSAAEISANNPNHSCDLVNPYTGVQCNKQFSRPYDLIRHQETIHASKKKIFRCVICEGRMNGGAGNGKQKTFSRGDALSRHIKVKHGLVGKDALDLINEAKDNVEYVSI